MQQQRKSVTHVWQIFSIKTFSNSPLIEDNCQGLFEGIPQLGVLLYTFTWATQIIAFCFLIFIVCLFMVMYIISGSLGYLGTVSDINQLVLIVFWLLYLYVYAILVYLKLILHLQSQNDVIFNYLDGGCSPFFCC